MQPADVSPVAWMLSNKKFFLSSTIVFLKGHSVARYVCSLAPLTPLTRSAALCFAMLASLACSVHVLAHSFRSLPHGTVEIHEYVFILRTRLTGIKAIIVVTRNTPLVPPSFCSFELLPRKKVLQHLENILIYQ